MHVLEDATLDAVHRALSSPQLNAAAAAAMPVPQPAPYISWGVIAAVLVNGLCYCTYNQVPRTRWFLVCFATMLPTALRTPNLTL